MKRMTPKPTSPAHDCAAQPDVARPQIPAVIATQTRSVPNCSPWMRFLALRLPLYEPGANLKVLCCCGGLQTSDADASRERISFTLPPNSGVPEFGNIKWPKSETSDFGRGRVAPKGRGVG